MTYKTTVEIQRDGSLVMTDGTLDKIGDMTFAYQALLTIIRAQDNKGISFQKDKDFKAEPRGPGFHSDQLRVTISPEFAKDAIAILKDQYKGLTIKNEQLLDLGKEHNLKSN
ncbi:Uncharacterised protein [Legionella steigerwaltii]|uniref:Uncharacterized protein n=1 Tax=Legionella steigerwaltii TaxID=460 RepID=A0A378L8H3_9GAMM|nr:hypothetical protein [Legionella steigerwaltii]KTD77714.1 hypothetical protein Lstg_2071 [Legionella steigerwaltii]STY23024.1 Uncharacterised protein [Legionella steigerwaltii]